VPIRASDDINTSVLFVRSNGSVCDLAAAASRSFGRCDTHIRKNFDDGLFISFNFANPSLSRLSSFYFVRRAQ
tara:strand:- start:146 stop:364 length:219 start_codon:yes stop_codon:yes gene_type:complete